MVKESEHETEILLGNKQLLGIFFVLAVLIGLVFTGGYMLGHGSSKKTPASSLASTESTTPSNDSSPATATTHTGGGETHSVGEAAPSEQDTQPEPTANRPTQSSAEANAVSEPKSIRSSSRSHKTEEPIAAAQEPAPAASPAAVNFTPQSGQTFLQVAAVGREEALAVADVLHKKGFRAHAVPKPGNPKLYRVLIGPIRDTADLSNTRDSLRHTGFREVIVQHY